MPFKPKSPHPFQTTLLEEIYKLIRGGYLRIVAQLPTGGGKTFVASIIIRGAIGHGKRVAFIAPALGLIDQTVAVLHSEGITDVGVMQAYHELTDHRCAVQVCTIQTLSRRGLPDVDVIIIDEVHIGNKFFQKIFEDQRFKDKVIIGLSATPWSKGLGKRFQKLTTGATTKQLQDLGFLAPFRVFAPGKSADLSGVHTRMGDYVEGELATAMNKVELVADVIDTWKERGENRPTFVFAVNCAHAKALQEKFIAAGIACEYIDAFTKREERNAIRDRFQAGETKVVCNVGCLTTGIDWDVRCLVLARPTKSEILFTQMVGRGLRTAEGKADCLILDHSDTHQRLGFVTDIHYEELDDGTPKLDRKKPGEALLKLCSACQYLKPPKTPKCPNCGFEAKAQSGAYHAAGELVEMRSRSEAAAISREEKKATYLELRYMRERECPKWSPKYPAVLFRKKFGEWPPFSWNDATPMVPRISTRGFVKSQQIAYAKSRNNRAAA